MRRLEGRHLELFTDLPSTPAVDELPNVFDAAVEQWGRYFRLPDERLKNWRMQGFLIGDKLGYQQIGMPPPHLPDFKNGYQQGHQLWLYEQPSDYYRRHLLLHEGVHGLMHNLLEGGGPPWYVEGLAELLATHRWTDSGLELAIMPADRDEVPQWGRIKIIRDALHRRQAITLTEILNYSEQAHLQVEPYGWCWGAAYLLNNYQPTQEAFRNLRARSGETAKEFNQRLTADVAAHWPGLALQWQLFVSEVDYGYDVEREQVALRPADDLSPQGNVVEISAERGWQSSGIRLRQGHSYRITGAGRYQIADQPKIWWCEPGGVTIRYHQGRPLGMLLAAVHDDSQPPQVMTQLARPWEIGRGAVITPSSDGTLFLKINEAPSQWRDNQGSLQVTVRPAEAPPIKIEE